MLYAVGIRQFLSVRYIHAPLDGKDTTWASVMGSSPTHYQWADEYDDIGWFSLEEAQSFQLRLRGDKAFIVPEPELLVKHIMES